MIFTPYQEMLSKISKLNLGKWFPFTEDSELTYPKRQDSRFVRRMRKSALRRKHLEFEYHERMQVKQQLSDFRPENCTLECGKLKYFFSSLSSLIFSQMRFYHRQA